MQENIDENFDESEALFGLIFKKPVARFCNPDLRCYYLVNYQNSTIFIKFINYIAYKDEDNICWIYDPLEIFSLKDFFEVATDTAEYYQLASFFKVDGFRKTSNIKEVINYALPSFEPHTKINLIFDTKQGAVFMN